MKTFKMIYIGYGYGISNKAAGLLAGKGKLPKLGYEKLVNVNGINGLNECWLGRTTYQGKATWYLRETR